MICLETDGEEENDDHWPSTVPYVNDASYLRISSTSNTTICLETDSEEDDDDYRPRTLETHHFIADRPPAPFNESFNDEEVVDEITGNNESVQLLGEISLPEATIVPSPDLWVGPDLWEGEDSDIWIVKYHVLSKNKFFRTKMRPKEGTKMELQRDLSDFVRFVRFSGLDLSD